MLLTLNVSCVRSLIKPSAGAGTVTLRDLPAFAREVLGLHGLNLSTDLLAGVGRDELTVLRERGDKAGCTFLLLIEPEAQPLGAPDQDTVDRAIERLRRVTEAAGVLGCSAVAASVSGAESKTTLETAVDAIREVVERAEALDLNVLLRPAPGMTARPEKLTELIKLIGGFRVGTCPDFQTASKEADPAGYLRRLTPYASAVIASTTGFTPAEGERFEHPAYDLTALLNAVLSVGYDGNLAIDYRGTGDVTLGVQRSRAAIQAALDKAEE